MEITGKLIKLLPEVSGESQRGPWVRGGFVIETDGEYPRQGQPAFGFEHVTGEQTLEEAHGRHADKGEQDRVENALDLAEEPRDPRENGGKIEDERGVE